MYGNLESQGTDLTRDTESWANNGLVYVAANSTQEYHNRHENMGPVSGQRRMGAGGRGPGPWR